MVELSIIIPARNELFLRNTIISLLERATSNIEIIPILDSYEPPPEELVIDSRVHYMRLPVGSGMQMRHGINKGVEVANGKYIMKTDAHCLFSEGFDEVLIREHQDNWVQILRRDRLDAENWCVLNDPRPPVDYEFLKFDRIVADKEIHGEKWDIRGVTNKDILVDDTMSFQGSMWFMTKDWFNHCGFMQTEGYGGFISEPEEITLTTWKNGGACKVNKKAWYAHLHKGKKYGRMWSLNRQEQRDSYAYAYNKWVVEEHAFFEELVSRFMPIPGWPDNWKKRIWSTEDATK